MPPKGARPRLRWLPRTAKIREIAKRAGKTAAEYTPYCTAAIQVAVNSSAAVSITLIAFSAVIKAVASKQEQAQAKKQNKPNRHQPKRKPNAEKKRQTKKQRQTRTKRRTSPGPISRSPVCGRPKVDGSPCQNSVKGDGPCWRH